MPTTRPKTNRQILLVVLIKVDSCDTTHHLDYSQYEQVQEVVSSLVSSHSDSFLIKKSVEELLLVMNGENPEQLKQDGLFLARLIKEELEDKVACQVTALVHRDPGCLGRGLGRKRQKFYGAVDIMNGELVEYGGKV